MIVAIIAILSIITINTIITKKESKIIITSNDTIDENGNLTFRLTNSNNVSISNEKVNIRITNENRTSNATIVSTDSNGEVIFKLTNLSWKYVVKISYYANKNFKGTIITKSLIIRNVAVAGNSAENTSQYGYCAICGVALTYEEANNEFIQSKVCYNCANNPYYQHCEADYANKKLYEKYPKDHECTMKMIGVIMMTIIDFNFFFIIVEA